MLQKDEATADRLSRQFRHADNTRFLRRLPGFELERELPEELLELLSELQKAENVRVHRVERHK
ncbi:hypothetical protein [Nitratireductor luteus]|uniref:hypothetical protein n=1 Tax=Nitratireductor luteus TaxID=2976980 RepID=UPI00224096F7|nr:hypothetical protein [Nitratireductor luteus]